MSRSNKGRITMLELMSVVAIIGLIAAVVMPGLVRRNKEASAIAALHEINNAQTAFAKSCGNGFYAPSLTWLSMPPAHGDRGFIESNLNTDPAIRSGYKIIVTPGRAAVSAPASCNGVAAGLLATTYLVGAIPNSGEGVRYFATSQDGKIYQHDSEVPLTEHGPRSGATEVQ